MKLVDTGIALLISVAAMGAWARKCVFSDFVVVNVSMESVTEPAITIKLPTIYTRF